MSKRNRVCVAGVGKATHDQTVYECMRICLFVSQIINLNLFVSCCVDKRHRINSIHQIYFLLNSRKVWVLVSVGIFDAHSADSTQVYFCRFLLYSYMYSENGCWWWSLWRLYFLPCKFRDEHKNILTGVFKFNWFLEDKRFSLEKLRIYIWLFKIISNILFFN